MKGIVAFKRPDALTSKEFTYCPGCLHGVAHRLVAEILDEMKLTDQTIMVAPVGCSVFAYEFFDVDGTVAPHGRATAVATGIKRSLPDRVVFTYQGDGDLAAIGTAETIHTANRGEKNHDYLYQQRHIRDDRRADGADFFGRHEDDHLTVWKKG